MKYQLFYEDKKIKWKIKEKFMNATMSLEKTKHYPVMLNQILSIISPQHGGTFIDCTFGGGGYSQAILKFPGTKVLAIDRDKLTQKYANLLVKRFPKRFNFFQEKFSNLNKVTQQHQNPKAVNTQRSAKLHRTSKLGSQIKPARLTRPSLQSIIHYIYSSHSRSRLPSIPI